MVILPSSKILILATGELSMDKASLNTAEIGVLSLIGPGGRMNASEVSSELGVTVSLITRILRDLQKRGLLSRHQIGDASFYTLTDTGKDLL
jgi:DNA-binding MarR family transcriptional regulator